MTQLTCFLHHLVDCKNNAIDMNKRHWDSQSGFCTTFTYKIQHIFDNINNTNLIYMKNISDFMLHIQLKLKKVKFWCAILW